MHNIILIVCKNMTSQAILPDPTLEIIIFVRGQRSQKLMGNPFILYGTGKPKWRKKAFRIRRSLLFLKQPINLNCHEAITTSFAWCAQRSKQRGL